MKKPFAELDPATIDDYIERTEQQLPQQLDSEDARFLRDLHYLHCKEEILQRAARRLQLVETADEKIVSLARPGKTSTLWLEQNTLPAQPRRMERHRGFAWPRLVAVLAAILLLLGALVGTSQFFRSRSQTPAHSGSTPIPTATATTTAGDILFSDPLSQNIHNFPIDSQHFFKNGAYHIRVQGTHSNVTVVEQKFAGPIAYTLTMEEITGDDTTSNNFFGLVFNYNVKARRGITCYIFGISNNGANSQYGFYKYDQSKSYPWQQLRMLKIGKEFHGGHGQKATNTVKVVENGSSFTFYVNDVQVGTARDSAPLSSGSVGMLVTLKGTEVAFTNMLVTRP